MAEESTSIIDTYFFYLSCQIVHPFGDKRLRHRGDITNPPVEPNCRINTVGEQISGDPRSGRIHIKTP